MYLQFYLVCFLITCILTLLVEVKSVYVRNVPSTAIASDIEELLMKFGKIRQDGVAIRTRKVSSFDILNDILPLVP